MIVSGNARLLVCENAILPQVAVYLNRLRSEKPEVFRHSLNVAYLVAEICLRNYISDDLDLSIEKDSMNDTIQGALLHDIGKLNIDNRILLKQHALTPEEITELRNHPLYGYEMIKDDPVPDIVKEIVLKHHEKSDGMGYPNGITEIRNEIKIVSICDKFDALTENRSYRPKKDIYTAFKILLEDQTYDDLDIFLLLASINEK